MVNKIFEFVQEHVVGCIVASLFIGFIVGLSVEYFTASQTASAIERLCVETVQQAYDLGPEEGMKLLATVFGVG